MNLDKKSHLPVILIWSLLIICQFFLPHTQAQAARKVSNEKQIEQVMKNSIQKGKSTISFATSEDYSTAQIQRLLADVAKSQGRLLSGSIRFSKSKNGTGSVDYMIELSDDAFMKIKRLKSKSDAVKAASKALKNTKYTTNYYSEDSYYDIFRRILQQHPEYNYDTSVWKSSNGAYGYRGSGRLTAKRQKEMMQKADRAAAAAVKKAVKPKMTAVQKAKAIHNYIVKNCTYARYQNAFTAYGVLVDGNAVCQGYAAAFNLMASKCGLQSMAVCGTAQGGAHAWNYVKTGKQYRYIDCTWDDTDAVGKGIVYTYFNVTAEKMKKDHVWNEADFPSGDIAYYKFF